MDFPANSLPAVNIFNQVQVVILSSDGGRQIRNVPCPDLLCCRCNVRSRRRRPVCRLTAATPVLLTGCPQNPVHRRFGCQVAVPVCQPRYDLTRWQAGKFRTVTNCQNFCTLCCRQCIRRTRLNDGGARIRLHRFLCRPALHRSQGNPQLCTDTVFSGASGHRFMKPCGKLLPIRQRGQSSPLSPFQ